MLTCIAIPLTCWLCAMLAIPRKPIYGDEVAELVYRSLGRRQQLLVDLAAAVTLAAGCCWLCRALFLPRAVRLIAPEAAQRHLHSLGRRYRLTILATGLTIAAFVAILALPADIHADLRDLRRGVVRPTERAIRRADVLRDASR